MAKFTYTKTGDIASILKDYVKEVKEQAANVEDTILIELNKRVLALTPVWEGELITNWRWSVGAPVFEHVDPAESPADPGQTGKVKQGGEWVGGMALGEEPRRPANILLPNLSLAGVLAATKVQPVDVFLSNASPIAMAAEYGLVPSAQRSRSPAGIVRIAMRQVFGDDA